MKCIGAIDIGGTKIAAGGIRADGSIAHRLECSTRPENGFDDAMRRVREMLDAVAANCGPLDGIGVACPGPLDPFTGILGEVGTLSGWRGGNLAEALQSRFAVQVAVENDADAAALAEVKWGAAKGSGSFLYLTISTGIGGGVILQGSLHRGVANAHPEIGHQIIDSSGPLCYCSARGCWESLASGSAMRAWVGEQQPGLDLTAEAICQRARQGDELALRAVRREAHYLGIGLANLITLFAPEAIALGGGVMKSSDLFLEEAVRSVRSLCTQVPADQTRITLSSLGSDAGLMGAAQAWLCRNPE